MGLVKILLRGTWVAPSADRPTSAQVMVSQFLGSSPVLGSVLTAQSLQPASDSASPSLSAPSPLVLCLSLSLSKINKTFFKIKKKKVLLWHLRGLGWICRRG